MVLIYSYYIINVPLLCVSYGVVQSAAGAFWDIGGLIQQSVMATNIEDIFRDFVVNKMKEIADETEDNR